MVIRLDRPAYLGGKAEFIYTVDVKNDDFGKPLMDPAFNALKAKFPDAKIASLRRAATKSQALPGFPEEKVIPVALHDAALYGNTRDWNPSATNFGQETSMKIGVPAHHRQPSRALIKVDLSVLSKQAEVKGAYLRLALSAEQYTGTQPGAKLVAHALRVPWNETQQADGYCCYNGPQYIHRNNGKLWGKQGADDPEKDRFQEVAAESDVGAFPVKLNPSDKSKNPAKERYRFVYLDLTALVKQWQAGSVPNHGLVLKLEGGGVVAIRSSEFQDYTFRPTLEVAYVGEDLQGRPVPDKGEDLDLARANALKTNKPLLVKFYSPLCSVCKQVDATTFKDTTVQKTLHDGYEVTRLKVEDHAKLAEKYGVGTVPAVLILDSDGKTKRTLIGSEALRASEKFLEALKASQSTALK